MTARLILESPRGTIDLDGVARTGRGVQVQAGVTGLGLPSRDVQYMQGAGHGAVFRSMRVLARDIDLPLHFEGTDRQDLKNLLHEFARVVSGACTLRLVEDDVVGSWAVQVHLVGGGDYSYGNDTVGHTDLQTVVTLRAGDPFWERSYDEIASITTSANRSGLLNGSLANLNLSPGQAVGTVELFNEGDADSYPVWHLYGPGSNFVAVDPTTGRELRWTGTLQAGERLTIDTRLGTVKDGTGASRYAELAEAPHFWRIPPGSNVTHVGMDGTSAESRIDCLWRPRKWLVV